MADAFGNKAAKDYHLDIAPPEQGFFAKGLGHGDWGLKNRLSRLFNPKSGNTVMLAFDHGYMMGSTSGLERMDVTIAPLAEYADVLMATRGALRTCIPPTVQKPICLRATHDASVLKDDMSIGSGCGADMEAALRMNASAVAIQCFVGAEGETASLETLCRAVDAGERYGMPVLGVTAVGKQMARTTQYFLLATRMLAELGATFVKTYYCDDFEKVVAACPVPIVIAGGKKLPEQDALSMAYKAIASGAKGVDMGRNIFQSEHPAAMCRAVAKIVHEGANEKEAFEFYQELANSGL
ncbi:MAG: 3-hydroxy-5-phosphonooxypentane-2,4-dione thiolase [Clostridium sp.]|nr:3-hydroxy-5-phosphonooxypentane-2,4-dione thiolase [Clostridium sp.]